MGNSCCIIGKKINRKTGKYSDQTSALHRALLRFKAFWPSFSREKANKVFLISQRSEFRENYDKFWNFATRDSVTREEVELEEPSLVQMYDICVQNLPLDKADSTNPFADVPPEAIAAYLESQYPDTFGKVTGYDPSSRGPIYPDGVKEYTLQEATERAVQFNKQRLGDGVFICIPWYSSTDADDNARYRCRIVENTRENQTSFITDVLNDTMRKDTLDTLVTMGAIDPKVKVEPRVISSWLYQLSTKDDADPVEYVDGYKIGDDESEFLTDEQAYEHAKMMLDMLGRKHPLIERLFNIAKKNRMSLTGIIGNADDLSYMTDEELVIQTLAKVYKDYWKYEEKYIKGNAFFTLCIRILNWFKRNFFTFGQYEKKYLQAKYAAFRAVQEVLGPDFKCTLEYIMSDQKVTAANKTDTYNIRPMLDTLLSISQQLTKTQARLKKYDSRIFKKYDKKITGLQDFINGTLSKLNSDQEENIFEYGKYQRETMLEFLGILNFVTNEATSIFNLLNGLYIDYSDTSLETIKDQAAVIKYAEDVEWLIKKLSDVRDQFIRESVHVPESAEVISEIQNAFDNLTRITTRGISTDTGQTKTISFSNLLHEKRKKLAISMLCNINGDPFIAIGQYVAFDRNKRGDSKLYKLKKNKPHLKSLIDEIETIPVGQAFTMWQRFIDGMGESPDVINQLIYDLVEQKKQEANLKTLDMKDRLIVLYGHIPPDKTGLRDTKQFFETDDEGNITNNIISDVNWGTWEKNYQAFVEKVRSDFFEKNKDFYGWQSYDEMFKSLEYSKHFNDERKKWHAKHSILTIVKNHKGEIVRDKNGDPYKVYKPNANYTNPKYYELIQSPAHKQWLDEYMSIKQELDELLPMGSTNMFGVRVPQFKGTFVNRLRNVKLKNFGSHMIRNQVLYELGRSPSDTEFGGETDTYDDIEDSNGNRFYTRELINDLNSIQRLPMYGVKKFKHTEELSTDLCHSLLAYANMAYSYNCLDEIIDGIEVLKDAVRSERDPRETSNLSKPLPASYYRLEDYLQMQVYNNYADPDKTFTNVIGRKAGQLLSMIGSTFFLGWNMGSATVNALTGFWQMARMAGAGQMKPIHFLAANVILTKYALNGILRKVCRINPAKGSDWDSYNKWDLLGKRWNIRQSNTREFRDWNIGTMGYGLFKGGDLADAYRDIAMLPYSLTEDWMQGVSYICTAMATEVIHSKTGKVSTLWDIYKEKDRKLIISNGDMDSKRQWVSDADNPPKLSDWLILDEKLEKKLNQLTKKEENGETLSRDEKYILYESKIVSNETSGESYLDIIQKKKSAWVPLDEKQENRFMLKCRNLNNHMHGVYNTGDGGAYLGTALGGAIASLRKYAIGMIDDRFARLRYDYRLGDIHEGSYQTLYKYSLNEMLEACYNIKDVWVDKQSLFPIDSDRDAKILQTIKKGGNYIFGSNKFAKSAFAFFQILKGIGNMITVYFVGSHFRRAYLRKQGFSETQISNLDKVWMDCLIPHFLEIVMCVCQPPLDVEPDDVPEWINTIGDYELPWYLSWLPQQATRDIVAATVGNSGARLAEIPWLGKYIKKELPWLNHKNWGAHSAEVNEELEYTKGIFGVTGSDISWFMTKFYVNTLNKLPGEKTVNDDKYINASEFAERTYKLHQVLPFSVKAGIYYLAYRNFVECGSWNFLSYPTLMFSEFKTITGSSLPGATAVFGMGELIGYIREALFPKTEEELDEMAKTGGDKIKDGYDNGKRIYQKGLWKDHYKWAKKVARVTPTRGLETFFDGYSSQEAAKFFQQGSIYGQGK